MGPRVLVFGSTGQLAGELARAGAVRDDMDLTFVDRRAADFADPGSLRSVYKKHQPDITVIAAAYTAVDKAETEDAVATTVNAQAPQVIAEAAAESSSPVIFVSTDYVFDGRKDGFYIESDEVGPINAYGRSKLAGERLVRAANPRHVILRTSWIYSASGTNFVRTMMRLAATQSTVRVVADQQGCPTSARDLAKTILAILPALLSESAPWGTYHAAGAADTTWHGLAEAIFTHLGAAGMPRPTNIAVDSGEFPTAAERPRNSRLSSALLKRTFGVAPAGWSESLPIVMAEIQAGLEGRVS